MSKTNRLPDCVPRLENVPLFCDYILPIFAHRCLRHMTKQKKKLGRRRKFFLFFFFYPSRRSFVFREILQGKDALWKQRGKNHEPNLIVRTTSVCVFSLLMQRGDKCICPTFLRCLDEEEASINLNVKNLCRRYSDDVVALLAVVGKGNNSI